jgi:hypothetical protein
MVGFSAVDARMMFRRSYASNINDSNAGNGVEKPLNIDDSDDDTVEVVHQVRRPA